MTTPDGEAREGSVERLRAQCASVGFDLDHAKSSLVDRMLLLAEHSETFADARRMTSYAEQVLRHYETTQPDRAFSPLERQTLILACLFSDIGKTGPADADADGRRLVAEAFAVENVQDDGQPMTRFFQAYFPADAEARIARFRALGLDPGMTIRQLWNLHSGWTLAIGEDVGLPREAIAAAAAHHMLEDINPRSIVGEDLRFRGGFGGNTRFDRAEKLVIILDKYDASIRRGGRTHDEAIAWIRGRIAANPRFRDDREFLALVADVDRALRSNA